MRRTLFSLPVAGLLAASPLAACGGSASSADDGLDVVAGFYPLAFAAEQIGGDRVEVNNLTPAGVEPHDLELAPSDIAAIEEADFVVHLEGFIPALDEAVSQYASDSALEVSSAVDLIGYDDTEAFEGGHDEDEHADEHEDHDDHADEDEHDDHDGEHEDHADEDDHAEEDDHADEDGDHGHDHDELDGTDPHFWLDPVRYAAVGEVIASELSAIDADGDDDYTEGAAAFTEDLHELDEELAQGLADRTDDDIVTSHAAFGYLADRYGLHQVAISGLSPDQEASSQRMAEIAEYVEEHGVTTIFFETLVSSDIADTVAAETGAETATLNPLEGLTADEVGEADYFSIMRDNLAALQGALGSD
ncbi:metal ABC transporter substrate-binding protein [Glycomyces xiaoerkulensis]|uniref:metal ABC transporter substrate-binding protein n=1 Tax=Glycomyces xiaoerkulensis TaxID=2038139 RepID=UPI0018E42DD3|nr:metal ABC transporter substrate-binding protein [Glycomyces xiaoerkulensis]